MDINSMKINNDKKEIVFTESVDFSSNNYSNIVGDRMLLVLNAFNRNTYLPKKYRNRKLPLIIRRGFKDVDSVKISLPEKYSVEAVPKNIEIINEFGKYKLEITMINDNTLMYHREFIVNDGAFPKEDYQRFRDFYKNVLRIDQSKLALIKK